MFSLYIEPGGMEHLGLLLLVSHSVIYRAGRSRRFSHHLCQANIVVGVLAEWQYNEYINHFSVFTLRDEKI